jgi:hypothetical protein
VKGKAEPIEAWEVAAAHETRTRLEVGASAASRRSSAVTASWARCSISSAARGAATARSR